MRDTDNVCFTSMLANDELMWLYVYSKSTYKVIALFYFNCTAYSTNKYCIISIAIVIIITIIMLIIIFIITIIAHLGEHYLEIRQGIRYSWQSADCRWWIYQFVTFESPLSFLGDDDVYCHGDAHDLQLQPNIQFSITGFYWTPNVLNVGPVSGATLRITTLITWI